MKRCPTCNRTFTDEWLTFCTSDGTPLVSDQAAIYEAPPVEMPQTSDSVDPQRPAVAEPVVPAFQPAPSWQPPPPPLMPPRPSQNLAVASMVLGLISITLGWCCSFGLLTAPVAIVLGIVSLSHIKSDPQRNGGKPLAIAGLVMGIVYFAAVAVMILIYGLGILLSGVKSL